MEVEAELRRVFWGPKGKEVARACCLLESQVQREGPGLCMRLGNVWVVAGEEIPVRTQAWGLTDGGSQGWKETGEGRHRASCAGKSSLYLGD